MLLNAAPAAQASCTRCTPQYVRSAPGKETPAGHRGIVEQSLPAVCATARCRRACREALQGRRCAAAHQVQRLPSHQVYRMRRPGDHGAPVRALHHSVSLHSAPRIIALVLGPGIIECCGGVCGPHAACDEGELVRSTHWPDPLRFDAQDCDNLIRGTTSADLYPLHRGSVGRQGVLAPKATEAAHGV